MGRGSSSFTLMIGWCILVQLTTIAHAQQQVACAPSYSSLKTWSSLFGGQSGDIHIQNGVQVLLDVPTVSVGSIIISQGSSLVFDWQKNIQVTAASILINGELDIGSESCPFQNKVNITLTGTSDATLDGTNVGQKVLAVGSNGVLELHGAKGLGKSWTKLSATANPGDTTITVADDISSWSVGDTIAVASTDYDPSMTELVVITGIPSSNKITISTPLKWNHFGAVSYEVDMSAEVALLSRNIHIQGSDDGAALGHGFGAHVIGIVNLKGLRVEGVELTNSGQNMMARYPLHAHRIGTAPDNTYFRYNSIHSSHFRCITIHGTDGVTVQGNVAYNNYGHCYYLEDGVEQNNQFINNVGLLSLPKTWGDHIGTDGPDTVTTFWITNPNNKYVGNVAAGANTGYWIETRLGPSGLSTAMPQYQNLNPSAIPLAQFDGNTAHSCENGLQAESINMDAQDSPAHVGALPGSYNPINPDGSMAQTIILNFLAYKIRNRGVWMRVPDAVVKSGKFSNCFEGIELAGSGSHPASPSMQYIDGCVFVGWSDNTGNNVGTQYQLWAGGKTGSYTGSFPSIPWVGVKLYDGGETIQNCKFQNYQEQRGQGPNAAIGPRMVNVNQMATTNTIKGCTFSTVDTMVGTYGQGDGGKTFNFRNPDGSVDGYINSEVLPNEGYYTTSACVSNSAYGLACPHKYVQVWLYDMDSNGDYPNSATITRANFVDSYTSHSMSLDGIAGVQNIKAWQPIVSVGASYLVNWQVKTPQNLLLQLNNAEMGESVNIALCYPPGTSIQGVFSGYADGTTTPVMGSKTNSHTTPLSAASCKTCVTGGSYYWEAARNILYVQLLQRNERTDIGNFCPTELGCDWVWVQSQGSAAGHDCSAAAFSGDSLQISSGAWLSQQLTHS